MQSGRSGLWRSLVVALAVFGGFRGEEIARILRRNHSTVRSRYRRALKKLEKSIQNEEVRHDA